ncbi:hypothetical protein [Halobaculum lipolyticum]|uniref:Uncharacterized protein n=1 Tax=Halobaculum lipolyticum TaxID=3032001 RepID=A0ABD5WCP7_9EURY|nr:hypothetical protein [Halobaculum sp. DT31]
MSDPDEQGESPDGGATESADEPAAKGAEAPPEGAGTDAGSDSGDEQPDIDSDEQAVIPSDIDPDEVEAEAGADDPDNTEESDETTDESADEGPSQAAEPESMAADDSPTVAKAGEMYVSVVRSLTNAQIRKHGGESELGRDHFEQYDLAEHFDATMEQMGVGSDLDPHEALLFATILSMGDGLTRETDVLDRQIERLLDKAMGVGQEVAA